MTLVRIMYVSESASYTSPEVLRFMAAQASRKNAEKDITGILLNVGNVFFQILEGDQSQVVDLYQTISRDSRHHHVRIVDKEYNATRAFGQWNMGCLNLDEEFDLDYKGFRELREQVQSIVQDRNSSKQAFIEIIRTLPSLIDRMSKKAA